MENELTISSIQFDEEKTKLNNEIQEILQSKEKATKEVQILTQQTKELINDIETGKKSQRKLQNQITLLNEQIEDQQLNNKSNEKIIQNKDNQINNLKKQLTASQKQISQLENQNQEKSSRVELSQVKAQLEWYKNKLQAAEECNQELKGVLDDVVKNDTFDENSAYKLTESLALSTRLDSKTPSLVERNYNTLQNVAQNYKQQCNQLKQENEILKSKIEQK